MVRIELITTLPGSLSVFFVWPEPRTDVCSGLVDDVHLPDLVVAVGICQLIDASRCV